MTAEKLPAFVNRYPDGRGTLTCAHCAIDAKLDGAHATALYASEDDGQSSIIWSSALTAEELLAAAADPCQHLAAYREPARDASLAGDGPVGTGRGR
jgi:hypothetical protein